MSDVFVTRPIPTPGLEILEQAGLTVAHNPDDRPLDRAELLSRVPGCRAILSLVTEQIDEEVLAAAGEQLKVVANYAVGYDNIDVAACTARGVRVTNTPDVLTNATADMTMMLMLATARRAAEADAFVRAGRWQSWSATLLLGVDVTGQTLGIVGMGRIGRAVAARARGFDMRVLYHNRQRDPASEAGLGVHHVPHLEDLLADADFVSIHVPLGDATRQLIGAAELRRMKQSAILINTARGPIVDERALVKALRESWIWGAGLDVFEAEPHLAEGLTALPNVVLAPHLGSATVATRAKMAELAARSVVAVLRGEIPDTLVNREVLG